MPFSRTLLLLIGSTNVTAKAPPRLLEMILRRLAIPLILVSAATVLDASSAVAQASSKPSPYGIYSLLAASKPENPSGYLGKENGGESPLFEGYVARAQWIMVEPADGKFDWHYFDEVQALAAKSGKKFGIAVLGGIHSPPWVYDSGVPRFNVTLRRAFEDEQASRTMPLVWNKTYLEKLGQFIAAMGQRYDRSPQLAYVAITGMGATGESYVVHAPEDLPKFNSLGGLPAWQKAAQAILDMYAKAFPTTPIILPAGSPIPGSAGEESMRQVLDYGFARYPHRFGVVQCGLNAGTRSQFYLNGIIQSHSDQSPVGLQMAWSTRGYNARLLKGTLREALDRGLDLKAHWIEVYADDVRDPANSRDLQQAGAALKRLRRPGP